MTNGTVAIGRSLVERAGVQDIVELVMDGEEAGAWKPAKAAYMYCCDRLKLQPSQVIHSHEFIFDRRQRDGGLQYHEWISNVYTAIKSRP